MASSKEDALNEILHLAATHGITTIIIEDSDDNVEVSAPNSLAVTGKMRGRKLPGTDRLAHKTLFLEISFRERTSWTSPVSFEKPRFWN